MVTLQKQGTSTLFAGLLPAVLKIVPAVAISLLVRDSILLLYSTLLLYV